MTAGERIAAELPHGSASEREFIKRLVDQSGYIVLKGGKDDAVVWPTLHIPTGAGAVLLAAQKIEFYAIDAMENDPDEFESGTSLYEEMMFWHRISQESKRLALWAIDGLGIAGLSVSGAKNMPS